MKVLEKFRSKILTVLLMCLAFSGHVSAAINITKYRNLTLGMFDLLLDVIGVLPDIVDGIMDVLFTILIILAIIVMVVGVFGFIPAILTALIGYLKRIDIKL